MWKVVVVTSHFVTKVKIFTTVHVRITKNPGAEHWMEDLATAIPSIIVKKVLKVYGVITNGDG